MRSSGQGRQPATCETAFTSWPNCRCRSLSASCGWRTHASSCDVGEGGRRRPIARCPAQAASSHRYGASRRRSHGPRDTLCTPGHTDATGERLGREAPKKVRSCAATCLEVPGAPLANGILTEPVACRAVLAFAGARAGHTALLGPHDAPAAVRARGISRQALAAVRVLENGKRDVQVVGAREASTARSIRNGIDEVHLDAARRHTKRFPAAAA